MPESELVGLNWDAELIAPLVHCDTRHPLQTNWLQVQGWGVDNNNPGLAGVYIISSYLIMEWQITYEYQICSRDLSE